MRTNKSSHSSRRTSKKSRATSLNSNGGIVQNTKLQMRAKVIAGAKRLLAQELSQAITERKNE